MGLVEAYELYSDGDISLAALGESALDEGHNPKEIREMLTSVAGYPIPVGYFGAED